MNENYKTSRSRPLLLPPIFPFIQLTVVHLKPFSLLGFQIPTITMLDSGNLAPSPPLSAPCSITDAAPAAPNAASGSSDNGSSAYTRVLKRTRGSLRKTDKHKSLWDRLTDPQSLPFLVAAPKMVRTLFFFYSIELIIVILNFWFGFFRLNVVSATMLCVLRMSCYVLFVDVLLDIIKNVLNKLLVFQISRNSSVRNM